MWGMDQTPSQNNQNASQGNAPAQGDTAPRAGFRSFATDIEAAKAHKPVGFSIPTPTKLTPESLKKELGIREIPAEEAKKPEQAAPQGPIAVPYVNRFESGIETSGQTYESFRAATVAPELIPKEDPKPVVDALHKEPEVPNFHSMQSDATTAVKKEETSFIKIAIAEEEKRKEHPNVVEDPRRSFLALTLGGIMLFGGLVAIGTYYVFRNKPIPTPIPSFAPTQIIASEATRDVLVTGSKSPIQAIVDAGEGLPGTVKVARVNLVENGSAIASGRFLELANSQAPSWFGRALKPEFMAGLYNKNGKKQSFLIFKIESYDNAFSGMLKWEESIAADLAPMVGAGNASTTSPTSSFVRSGFVDAVVRNRDARVLYSAAGDPLIIYSFPNPSTLVVATGREGFEEVLARLTTSTFVR